MTTGIVLAAGAGTRLGMPKALVVDGDGIRWLDRATGLLLAAGCDEVTVVLGGRAAEVAESTDGRVRHVIAENWAGGMSESLKTGLAAARGDAALITLVDLPGLPGSVVARVLGEPVGVGSLRQAVFEGQPGHPVLIGRDHWQAVVQQLEGDRGAREYLAANGVLEIECSDLWNGRDVDTMFP